MRKCKDCKEKIVRYLERKSYCMAKKLSPDKTHFHYGVSYYRYGVCIAHHHTRIRISKIIWDPCLKCNFKGVTKRFKLPKYQDEKDEEISTLRIEVNKLKREFEKMRREMEEPNKPIELKWSKPKKIETKAKTPIASAFSKFKSPKMEPDVQTP